MGKGLKSNKTRHDTPKTKVFSLFSHRILRFNINLLLLKSEKKQQTQPHKMEKKKNQAWLQNTKMKGILYHQKFYVSYLLSSYTHTDGDCVHKHYMTPEEALNHNDKSYYRTINSYNQSKR